GFYYLICAEGGTAYNHSEVVFRSKNVFGPYESYKGNPILTQRHLPQDRPNQITTTGHADFVELPNGDWWAVYLGCRPYNVDYYNTGRETFLLPVTWKDGWPTFEEGKEPHPFIHKRPELPLSQEPIDPLNGNFTWKDDFAKDSLNLHWNFIRTPKETWYTIHDNHIFIEPREDNIHTQTNFSFIGRRQQHLQFEVSTKFVFENSNPKQAVGLVAFQNEKHYLFIGKRINAENKQEMFLEETNGDVTQILAVQDLGDNQKELFVKIEGHIQYYSFYYKTNPNQEWKPLEEMVDASLLSTKEAGGFVGTYLGMYASSNHFIK
ncbi:MAG: family 43 glycosylhydrolase, partial [Aequorivita sp.]|nr:family 43 glycosylhydrolase [Aequorivita sp.]